MILIKRQVIYALMLFNFNIIGNIVQKANTIVNFKMKIRFVLGDLFYVFTFGN